MEKLAGYTKIDTIVVVFGCISYIGFADVLIRWMEMNAGEWIGVFAGHVWILSQTNDCILYKSFCVEDSDNNLSTVAVANNGRSSHCKKYISEPECEKFVDHNKLLEDYFQLSVNLQELYKDWAQRGDCISGC